MGSLTEPVRLGRALAPSRVLFGPHATGLADERALSRRHVAYYRARAAGGAGVVVTEAASVTADDWPYRRCPVAARCASGWGAVATAVHDHGALALAGLGHSGSQGSSAHSQSVLWAPSAVADPLTREVPAAMGPEQVAAVVTGFADAAAAAVGAGLDGVEVDAGASALLRQFASPLTNHRDDAHGQDRLLLLRQVLLAARTAMGPLPLLALRLSCDELAPWAGTRPDDAVEAVRALAPLLDLLVVVRGGPYAPAADRPDAHTPPAFNTAVTARARRAAAGVPVVLQGSVVDAGQAQRALDDGVADLVEMTRAQIAEPRLVALVRAGHPERVRPCVLCNQACCVRDDRDVAVSCVVEPDSGHEDELPTAAPAPGRGHRVLVVGAGPAGLEAARVLAGSGCGVRVLERSGASGGALAGAAVGPGRERLAHFTRWQEAECARLGVRVDTSTTATAADVDAAVQAGAAVVLATGSVPAPRPWSRPDSSGARPAQLDVLDVLRAGADALPHGPVVLLDPVGGPVAVATAEWLAAAGRPVTVVTPDPVVGTQLSVTGDLAAANARLQRAGVRRELRCAPREAGDGRLVVEDVWTGARREVPCAVLVDCGHRLPEDSLHRQRPAVVAAGDAVAPRTLLEAVLGGRAAARDVLATDPELGGAPGPSPPERTPALPRGPHHR